MNKNQFHPPNQVLLEKYFSSKQHTISASSRINQKGSSSNPQYRRYNSPHEKHVKNNATAQVTMNKTHQNIVPSNQTQHIGSVKADSREGNIFGSNKLHSHLLRYIHIADLMMHRLGWPPAPNHGSYSYATVAIRRLEASDGLL